jgi:hypothetical protein
MLFHLESSGDLTGKSGGDSADRGGCSGDRSGSGGDHNCGQDVLQIHHYLKEKIFYNKLMKYTYNKPTDTLHVKCRYFKLKAEKY